MSSPERYIMPPEELELCRAQIPEAKRIIEAATIQLMRYRPFFGVLLASMPVEEASKWLSTAATNGRTLFYNPEFIAGMSDERKKLVMGRIDQRFSDPAKNAEMKQYIQIFFRKKTIREVIFIWEHETRHVVADHIARGKGYNAELYNIAADHYINIATVLAYSKSVSGMGQAAWFKDGNKTQFDKDKEFAFMGYGYCDFKYEGMFTEQIYDAIFGANGSGNEEGKGLKGSDVHANDSGMIGSGKERGSDGDGDGEPGLGDVDDILGIDPQVQPRLTQSQKNANDTIMRRAIENAVKSAGAGAPEEARKFVEEIGQPKINYLKLLRRTIERLFKQDVSFRRLHRRSFSTTRTLRNKGYLSSRQSIVLPSRTKGKTIRAGVFFDVSGSFTDDLLKPTIREIRGLCNQYEDFEVELACWSTELGNQKLFTRSNIQDIPNYKITTTGGTDVRCVFNALDAMKDPVDQVIIYTDGFFSDVSKVKDWAKKYGPKTLWVIIGNQQDWKGPFGNVIMFDKYLK